MNVITFPAGTTTNCTITCPKGDLFLRKLETEVHEVRFQLGKEGDQKPTWDDCELKMVDLNEKRLCAK